MEQHRKELLTNLRAGNRLALAQTLTLLESERDEDQIVSDELVSQWMTQKSETLRIGLTGAPG